MRQRLGRKYLALLSASAVSNLGDGIGTVAWPWIASLLTRDPMAIALVAVALRLPWLLFTLPAGVITDRFDRRHLVVAMDAIRCAVLVALGCGIAVLPFPPPTSALPDSPIYWLLVAAALAVGFAEVLRDNAAQTLMPALVPPSRLETANARLWSVELIANSLIGPPLAGVVLALALPLSFFLNGAGFGVAVVIMLSIRGSFRPQPIKTRPHWLTEMREGGLYLWRNRLLRDLAFGLGVLNAMDHLLRTALVLYAQEVLQLSSTDFGVLLTAGAIGGIAGGLCAERVVARIGTSGALRLTLLTTLLQLIVIALSRHAAPVFGLLVAGEFVGMIWSTITVTLRQRYIRAELLGRVNSVYRFFGWGAIPLGMAMSGLIVTISENIVGRQIALTMPFAVGALIMAVSTALLWQRLSKDALNRTNFE